MLNMKQAMQQAQALQKKMEEVQKKLSTELFTGTSGGGMVTVTITAKGIAKKITIDPSLLHKEDEKEILEDLIIAAFNIAKSNADKYTEEEMEKNGISADILNL